MVWRLLAHAAVDGFLILGLGCLAVYWCRQPIRRLRLIELTLLGALLVPCTTLLPGIPSLSLGWLDSPSPTTALVVQDDLPDLSPGANANLLPSTELRSVNAQNSTTNNLFPQERPAAEPSTGGVASLLTPVGRSFLGIGSVPQWIALAYLTIATLFLGWWLVGVAQLLRLLAASVTAPQDVSDLFLKIAGPGCKRVRLMINQRVPLAITCTLWRPFIVLPADLIAEGGAALEYCLAHEWAHIEGRDSERWHLTTLAQVCFFYVPFLWWLRRQVRLCQDYLADARAAQQAPETEDYAEYLVSLARYHLAPSASIALGIGDRQSNLNRRIHMLLDRRQSLERRPPGRWSLAVLFFGLCVLGVTATVRLDAREVADDKKTQPTKDEPKKADTTPVETLHYSGKVFDKDTNKGIPGAKVTVRRSLLEDPEQKERNFIMEESKHTTDGDGKYSFAIPPAQVAKRYLYIELDVEAPGYAPRKHFGYALSMILKNEKLGGRPFFENVDLRPAKEIIGVLKTPDDKPATGTKVMAYSNTDKKSDAFEYGSFADTHTDANGQFRLWIITPGPAYVWFLPTQFVPETHILKDNKRGDMGTFLLHEGPRIRGIVLDAQGKPIAGINVNALSQDRNEEITLPVADQINRSAVTDARGEFAMNPLPPGHYQIKPDEHVRDASIDKRSPIKMEAVFAPKKMILKVGAEPEPIEVRASPHVLIEAQVYDSTGKTTRGHEFFVFGQIDGASWFGQAKADPSGRLVACVPHGLEQVQLDLMTNEHSSLRWRRGDKGEYHNQRRVDLGTVNEDIRDIQIVRYKAPIVIVKVKGPDGFTLDKPGVRAVYSQGKAQVTGVSFEHQEDGRFRSEQMFPDEEVTITGHAEGYTSKPVVIKLAEGATKDIEVLLEKVDKQ
jgi:beta-lactamase regulating signal transducer with metallopeptidase domain